VGTISGIVKTWPVRSPDNNKVAEILADVGAVDDEDDDEDDDEGAEAFDDELPHAASARAAPSASATGTALVRIIVLSFETLTKN
jgi:hypothetical protein